MRGYSSWIEQMVRAMRCNMYLCPELSFCRFCARIGRTLFFRCNFVQRHATAVAPRGCLCLFCAWEGTPKTSHLQAVQKQLFFFFFDARGRGWPTSGLTLRHPVGCHLGDQLWLWPLVLAGLNRWYTLGCHQRGCNLTTLPCSRAQDTNEIIDTDWHLFKNKKNPVSWRLKEGHSHAKFPPLTLEIKWYFTPQGHRHLSVSSCVVFVWQVRGGSQCLLPFFLSVLVWVSSLCVYCELE